VRDGIGTWIRHSSLCAPAIARDTVSGDGGDDIMPKGTIVGLAGGALLFVTAPVWAQSSDDMQRAAERQTSNAKERAAQESDEQSTGVKPSEEQTKKAEQAAKDEAEAAKSSAEQRADEATQEGQQQVDKATQTGQQPVETTKQEGQQQTEKAKQESQQQVDKAKKTTEQPKPLPAPDPTIPQQ
jgi:hypothetical protein